MVKKGEVVDDFVLEDQNGERFSLKEQRGRKVLLSFHPLAWTPVCAKQMEILESMYDRFLELNTLPVGISVDSAPSKKAWAEALGIRKLRLLADFWPHGGVARMLGIFREDDGISERANIVLDQDGRVIFFRIYPLSEVPDFNEIASFLEGL